MADTLQPLLSLISAEPCSGSKTPICRQQIQNALFECTKNLGFQYLTFARWVYGGDKPTQHSYSTYISNIPIKWSNDYTAQKLDQVDPVQRFGLFETGALLKPYGSWQEAQELAHKYPLGKNNAAEKNYLAKVDSLFKQAASHGLKHGIYFNYGDNYCQMQMSLSGNKNPFHTDQKIPESIWNSIKSICILSETLLFESQQCDLCTTGIQPIYQDIINLTPTQKKILKLFMANKKATIATVAAEHKCTNDAVNHHLRHLRKKFALPGASGHMLAQFAREHQQI